MRSAPADFIHGVRLVAQGGRTWSRSPRLMALGLIPGIFTALLFGAGIVALIVWVDDAARAIAARITGDETPNSFVVTLLVAALIGGSALLVIYGFTAVTMIIGQPFFEHIAEAVGIEAGVERTSDEPPWWRSTIRGIGDAIRLLSIGAAGGIGLFLVALIPVVGSGVAFCAAALLGGRLLTLELTAYPLSRVGIITLGERRAALAARRPAALGFGVASYLLCLIPLGAVVTMPMLVAGATLLAAEAAPPQRPAIASA